MTKFTLIALAAILIVLCIGISTLVAAEDKQTYGGTDNCKMCHPDIFKDWSKMSHAQSFDLLVNVGEEKNPKCLPCHTTGYGHGGYVDEASTPGLKGVTCEACHGPGAEHMGDKTKTQRMPSGATCAACHQQQNLHPVEGNAK